MTSHALANIYFPTINDSIAPSDKLSTVIDHRFSTSWQQGILATDSYVDRAEKEYLAIADFRTVISKLPLQLDAHLYEILTVDRPVRPYFDLEWDAEQLDDVSVLNTFIACVDTCLSSIGFRTCRGLSIYTASGACSTRIIPSGKKASFHILFDTDEVFLNVAHHKQFIHTVLLPYIKANDALYWINAKHERKLVMDAAPYGRNQAFRLPYQSKYVSGTSRPLVPYDACYLFSEVYTAGLYEDPVDRTITLECPVARPIVSTMAGMESAEFPKIVALCLLLTPEFLQDYESARNLVWMLWGNEQTPRMREHIHYICQRGNNYDWKWVEGIIRGFKFTGITVGSLVKWARGCAGNKAVEPILQQYQTVYHEELFQVNMKPSQTTVIHQRYLGNLSFQDNHTMMIRSHLGTGKTVAITNLIRSQNLSRLLIISPRKSYTQSQLGVFSSDITLLPPLESYMEHSGSLSHLPYLIVQVESLHRIGDWFQPYDLVILDESESILHQLHSVMTNGDNLINNHQVLELVMRTAKRVILADAFMTDRTFHFVRELRDPLKTALIENTYQPYSREAILLQRESQEVNLDGFCERIMVALRAGRRIVVVWTSKHIGEEFEHKYLKGFSYLFYHSDSSKDDILGLQDVAAKWRDVQCLMMTTSITVGISYDPGLDELEFDEAFLYGSSTTALPRDIAQSLLRVRVLKANRLTYVTNTPVYAVEECGFTNVCNLLTAKEERLHPLARWTLCPSWAKWNHVYNENERRCSCTYYKDVLERYLVNSGYELKTEIEEAVVTVEDGTVEVSDKTWDSISDITRDQAEEIRRLIQRGEADRSDKRVYQKFVFRTQFVECEEEIMRAIWDSDKMEPFWNTVLEKRWTVDDMLAAEARKRFAIMSTQRIKRRETMERFLRIMGMRFSHERVVLSHERLVELGAVLEPAEAELRAGLGLRVSRRKGAWKVGNTIDLIGSILEEWSGAVVRSEAIVIKKNKKAVKEHILHLNETSYWAKIDMSTTKMEHFMIKM
jgi:hypothetical protein